MKKDLYVWRGLILVLSTIIVITIIYAVLTKRITIKNSNDYKKGYSWKISFKNLENAVLTGTAEELSKPTINRYDTKISTYNVALSTPGDSVSYTFDVVNEGNYNALISAIMIPRPRCRGKVDDAIKVCKHLKYTLNYVESEDSLYNLGPDIHIGDTLYKGQSRKMKLTLSYDKDTPSSDLINSDVVIYNLDIVILYSECDKKCNVRGYNAPE